MRSRDVQLLPGLEGHLAAWILEADGRVHGTTHVRPMDRFMREEAAALCPLPARSLPPPWWPRTRGVESLTAASSIPPAWPASGRVSPLASPASTLVALGRSLDDYAALVGGAQ